MKKIIELLMSGKGFADRTFRFSVALLVVCCVAATAGWMQQLSSSPSAGISPCTVSSSALTCPQQPFIINFAGDTTTGIQDFNGSEVAAFINGVEVSHTNTSHGVTELGVRSTAILGFGFDVNVSGFPTGDVGLSRDSAGVLDCGNGAAQDKSCTFNAAKFQPAGRAAVAGGVPSLIYNTASSSVATNIGAVTMVTAPATNANCPTNLTANCSVYELNWYVDVSAVGTSCTGSTTVTFNIIYQDPRGAGSQTITNSLTIATNSNGTLGNIVASGTQILVAKLSTAVQYSTTSFTAGTGCSPAPSYQITPILKLLS